jgi:hypothetical protein
MWLRAGVAVVQIKARTVEGLLDLVQRERRGEAVNRPLLAALLRMFASLGIYGEAFHEPFMQVGSSARLRALMLACPSALAPALLAHAVCHVPRGRMSQDPGKWLCARSGVLAPAYRGSLVCLCPMPRRPPRSSTALRASGWWARWTCPPTCATARCGEGRGGEGHGGAGSGGDGAGGGQQALEEWRVGWRAAWCVGLCASCGTHHQAVPCCAVLRRAAPCCAVLRRAVLRAQSRLGEEYERSCEVLDPSSRRPLIAAVEAELVGRHTAALLDPGR